MQHHTRSLAAFFLALVVPCAASAQSLQSFNADTTVPITANGQVVMDVYSPGAGAGGVGIGIGTAAPQAMLDVAGGIRPGTAIGSKNVKLGDSCSFMAEGTIAYDLAAHQLVYCGLSGGNLTWMSASVTAVTSTCTAYCLEPGNQWYGPNACLPLARHIGFNDYSIATTFKNGQEIIDQTQVSTQAACGAGVTWSGENYLCVNGTWADVGHANIGFSPPCP